MVVCSTRGKQYLHNTQLNTRNTPQQLGYHGAERI
jgi:hypothetical protein